MCIAKLNVERLARMDLCRNLTPAIIAYEGIQYRYMAPGVMESAHLDYRFHGELSEEDLFVFLKETE